MAEHRDNDFGRIWREIERRLEACKAPINAEIRAYPLPIPGCDAQYNHLLEQRATVSAELMRLDRIRAECRGTTRERTMAMKFLDTCPIIDIEDKIAVRNLLPAPLQRAG